MRRGFTLLELLVTISVVAILVTLILPLLSDARVTGQKTVSLANLRSNSTYMMAYAGDQKDEFLNPFTLRRLRTARGWNSCCVVFEPITRPGPGHEPYEYGWDYGQLYSASGTETFGYHWLAHMFYADVEAQTHQKTNLAPLDRTLVEWYREHAQEAADKGASWIYPSSYWYPPVFWQDAARFRPAVRLDAGPRNDYFIHRNKTSDVMNASGKVLLFENKDYATKGQPMWNTLPAKPQVACTDGSGKAVAMTDIIPATGPAGGGTSGATPPSGLRYPSGTWFNGSWDGELEMTRFDYGIGNGFDWSQGYGRPAYFWATRGGVRGRDIR
jgi:prepilin-type N-terminal cleavage/methylation domain-containing protein